MIPLPVILAFAVSFLFASEARFLINAHKDPEAVYDINRFVAQMELMECPPVPEYQNRLIGAQYVDSVDGDGNTLGICVIDIFHYRYIRVDKNLDPMYKKTTIAHESLHCLWGLDHNEDDEDSLMYPAPRRFESEEEILNSALKEAGCLK
jgi:hypothetical protein